MEVGEALLEKVIFEQGFEGSGDVDIWENWSLNRENSNSEALSWMRSWRPGW